MVTPSPPEDTIAAIATPPGEGGIAIVRVSGSEAVPLVGRLFFSQSGRRLEDGTRQVYYGEIRDGDVPIDEVLVHVMRAPNSYTREDVVEINGHGGGASVRAVLECVLRGGARLAEAGEFTRRAFLNGRIDLVQAEAVIDRIQAQTHAGLQAASAAAHGVLSEELFSIREALVLAKSHIEAAIDFSDQELPEPITPELRGAIDDALDRMQRLLATADAGRLLREGAEVAIAGRPNVGKSSLFNALLRDARAIVTETAGTTRDLLRETLSIDGIPVRLTDAAGLRDAGDEVERIGVERARAAISEAALILFVVDASDTPHPEDRGILESLRAHAVPIVTVYNKVDLVARADAVSGNGASSGVVYTSTLNGQGLDTLESTIAAELRHGAVVAPDSALITRVHQKDSLHRALEAVRRVAARFDDFPELMAIELDDALAALGEITGETTPDEVLDHIFGAFCIGK